MSRKSIEDKGEAGGGGRAAGKTDATVNDAAQETVDAATAGSPGWGHPLTLLTLYIATLIALPAEYVVIGVLGSSGRPSVLIGLGLLVLWLVSWISSSGASVVGATPLRPILLFYFFVWTTSVGFAFLRGLSGIESRGAERFLITTVSLCGVALAISELLPDRESLDRFLRRLTIVGAFMGIVGVLQFYTPIDLVRIIRLPLPLNGDIDLGLGTRGSANLTRAAATTQHSIEFAVLAAMLLPLAIHFALSAETTRERRWRWVVVALCGAGVPLSVTRSGVIAVAFGLLVLWRVWNTDIRVKAAAMTMVVIVALRVTTPGLVGTLISFFRNAGSDNSVEGRTQDYELVTELFVARPVFGLGGGTFRPEEYFILDNYILNALVSTGLVGLLALLVLFFGPYSLSIRVGRGAASAADRHLGFALAASILAGFGASFTFDSLNFPGFAGLIFVFIGSAGALWRFRNAPRRVSSIDRVVRDREGLRPVLTRHVDHEVERPTKVGPSHSS